MNIEIMEMRDPEVAAMLQAFYSRSPKPIRERLRELDAEWLLEPTQNTQESQLTALKQKLNQWYVGYNHASIGELGEIVIFIEDVSFVAAKAIQHHSLYKGQEVSTRYVDFSNARPAQDVQVNTELFLLQREAYIEINRLAVELYQDRYQEFENDPAFTKTVKAKAFDLARGFLPVSCRTSLAWTTNLRNAADHLERLAYHPLPELRSLVLLLADRLEKHYPSAFGRYKDREGTGLVDRILVALNNPDLRETRGLPSVYAGTKTPTLRPLYIDTPSQVSARNLYRLAGMLDFGTWRDLARHRVNLTLWPGYIEKSILVATLLLYYSDQEQFVLDAEIHSGMAQDIQHCLSKSRAARRVKTWLVDQDVQVRMMPQGNRIMRQPTPVDMILPEPNLRYIAHLRTQKTVHNNLRAFMRGAVEGSITVPDFPQRLHYDLSNSMDLVVDNWTLKRGLQDIVKKEGGA